MSAEESCQVDEARRRYFDKCADFRIEVDIFFKHYKPRHYGKPQPIQAH